MSDLQGQSLTDSARIMVVDGSRVVRTMIKRVLAKDLPTAEVICCATGNEAVEHLDRGLVDLVITALQLSDMDGQELSHYIREHSSQRYIPIIVVSGDTRQTLIKREFSVEITDYFDKGQGYQALSAFIHGYVRPDEAVKGKVLYVEDSRVVAVATQRMLAAGGMSVDHKTRVEDALETMEQSLAKGLGPSADMVLTDVYLKGGLTGMDLLQRVRGELKLNRQELPILVMTGDDDRGKQSALLKAGANDLVEKPIEERVLISKLRFQLRIAQSGQRGD